MMKLYWKKQFFNPYIICVVAALPILTFLFIGFDSGMLPKFWQQMYPGESAAGDDLWIFSHVRHLESFVDAMEWYIMYSKYLFPIFASLAVLPFISTRDCFLPFARVRMQHPNLTEYGWIAGSVLRAGGTVYCSYLLTMLFLRWFYVDISHGQNFDVFVNQWGWSLSADEKPYLYVLALGLLRCFLLPMLMALLTVAVSYLTNKIYIYLLVPTIYNFISYPLFSQGIYKDKWPLPLFSPENITWPSSPDYWSYGHDVHGIWGVVGASLIIIIPSVLMIWYGIRKRRA